MACDDAVDAAVETDAADERRYQPFASERRAEGGDETSLKQPGNSRPFDRRRRHLSVAVRCASTRRRTFGGSRAGDGQNRGRPGLIAKESKCLLRRFRRGHRRMLAASGGEAARMEVSIESRCIARRIGKADVAVGTDEIEGVAPHSGMPRLWSPSEHMQGNASLGARLGKPRIAITINVGLPIDGFERHEVIAIARSISGSPWQAVAASDRAGPPFAQAAVPIVDRRLRDRAEHEAAHGLAREQRRHDAGHDFGSDEPGHGASLGYGGEGLVRRRHEPASEGDSFGLIGIEQPQRGSALQQQPEGGDELREPLRRPAAHLGGDLKRRLRAEHLGDTRPNELV